MRNMEQRKQWHMGFYGAMELEFREEKECLEFYREYQLSKKPLEMDMLVVRKNSETLLKNPIGKIFRKHNIIEYKSPKDALGIDQFYKGISYVCLYKSLGTYVNEIDANELTLTFVREKYPSKLMGQLMALGYNVEEQYPGIFCISGNVMFPIQIVVSSKLEMLEHLSLKVLSSDVNKNCAKTFVRQMSKLEDQGDKENIDAVLQISVAANRDLYDEIKEENKMCEALRELMKDEIEAEKSKAFAEGKLQAIQSLMKNMKFSAEQAMAAIGIPKSEYAQYLKML